MATTALGNQLTAQHRQRQLTLRALVLRLILRLWPAFDIKNIDESWKALESALMAVIAQNRAVSAGLAGAYYREFREAEQIAGTPPLITLPNDWQTATRVSLLVTGPIAAKQLIKLNRPDAAEVALVRLSGAVTRHVLEAGRLTILESVKKDPAARGWSRVTDGDPCAFCAMLASRGAVYRSEESGSFQAHDACGCSAEPAFTLNAPLSPEAQRFREIYEESTAETKGKEAIAAFRRAYEGRDKESA